MIEFAGGMLILSMITENHEAAILIAKIGGTVGLVGCILLGYQKWTSKK